MAYGTMWVVVMVMATVMMTHIDMGNFGYFGFPALSILYAMVRTHGAPPQSTKNFDVNQQVADLHEQNSKFMQELELLKIRLKNAESIEKPVPGNTTSPDQAR